MFIEIMQYWRAKICLFNYKFVVCLSVFWQFTDVNVSSSKQVDLNTRWRLYWPYAITRLTAHFIMCLLTSGDCKFRKSMVIHGTECPYWDKPGRQGVINLSNAKPTLAWFTSVRVSLSVSQWMIYGTTRQSTQRAQTSFVEADHHSHIVLSHDQPGL